MSACCLSGRIQEGKPKGREQEIGGLPTYVAEPENGDKTKTVIFLVDSKSTGSHTRKQYYTPSEPAKLTV